MVILQHLYHMGRHSIGPSTGGSSSQNCGLFRFHRLTSRICPNTLGALTVSQMRILKHLKIGIELMENDQNIHSVSKLCTLMQYSLVFYGDRPCHSCTVVESRDGPLWCYQVGTHLLFQYRNAHYDLGQKRVLLPFEECHHKRHKLQMTLQLVPPGLVC